MGARRRGRWTTTSSTPSTARQQPPGISPRDKALYAQHDAGPKNFKSRFLTETRQLTHSMTSAFAFAVDRTRRDHLRTVWQGAGRGRRECRLLVMPLRVGAPLLMLTRESMAMTLLGRWGSACSSTSECSPRARATFCVCSAPPSLRAARLLCATISRRRHTNAMAFCA